MMGMHGEAFANLAIQEADLLIALGMRFDDRVTGKLESYSPHSRKIHVDLDAAEINKLVNVDVSILGDLPQVLDQLLPQVKPTTHEDWLKQIDVWLSDTHNRNVVNRPVDDLLTGPQVVHEIWEATEGNAIVVTDVGQHQMWTAQYYRFNRPLPLVTSGGLGTMGFGLPAAVGTQIAAPDEEVWVIVGDGGFQMTAQELGTIIQEKLPIRIALINNSYLGMVRQWQELFFDERYESTYLVNPDFVRLVEAYGIRSWRATSVEESRQAIVEAREHDGPTFIEFQIAQKGELGNVYPMVPAGAALHEMIRRTAPEDTDAEDQVN
jgi:acetolactate synthase-1/2/3 large subunit